MRAFAVRYQAMAGNTQDSLLICAMLAFLWSNWKQRHRKFVRRKTRHFKFIS